MNRWYSLISYWILFYNVKFNSSFMPIFSLNLEIQDYNCILLLLGSSRFFYVGFVAFTSSFSIYGDLSIEMSIIDNESYYSFC